jgi:glycerophosphoryl diester phosphodiesterase
MIPPHFDTLRRPLVIGHRGASGHAVENSATAFRIAADRHLAAHCDAVELDIHATSDGALVVHHDAELASGERISAIPIRTVRASRLADGSTPLTLREALSLLAGVAVWIEVKTLPPDCDDGFLATISAADMPPCYVHAFDHRIVARLHARAPALTCGVLSCCYPVDPVAVVTGAGARVLWQTAEYVDEQLIQECRRADIGVIAWHTDEREEIARLVALGVDGICGDWPDRIRAATDLKPTKTAPDAGAV